MKQVRDIAYDMEDCVDDFAHRLRHDPRGDGCLVEVYRALYEIYTCRPRCDIAAKLAELKNRAQQVGERRLRYGVVLNPIPPQRGETRNGDQTTGENQVAGRRLITVKEPIGVARAIEKLEAWMKSQSHKNRGVLAIHGFGGGGKSTIAAALYRKHGQNFDCRAWVTMPQKFDDRAVLRSILSQVMLPATASGGGDRRRRGGSRHAKIETMSQEQLIKGLKNHLQNKSYILVVDDVRSAEAWQTIRQYLPDEEGSRVVVTTRFEAVAGECILDRQKDMLHHVDRLSDDDAKRLFQESVSESIHSSDVKHAKETMDRMNLSHVRSVTVFGSLNQLPFMSLKLGIVQVLDLEGCKGFKKQHVKDIFKMLLLKYLNLRGTDINSIPSKIGKLRYLETLDIRDTNVQKLPDAIVQLERLTSILGGNTMAQVTLKLPAEATKKPLRTLHILSGIEITGEPTSVNDFHGYTALRKLGIHKLQIQEGTPGFKALLSSIQYLGGSSLKNLLINDECSGFIDALDSLTSPPRYFHSLQLYGMFIKVPRWIAHLTELKNLTLSVTVLRTDTLELLQKLPRMFCLIFSSWTSSKDLDLVDILEKNKSDSEGQILVKHGGFDCLKLLRLDAPLLPLLVFSERAMGNLERLDMKFNTLEGVFGMDNLASLREVHMTAGEKAGEITKSIVRELEAEAGKYANTPRVVVYELAGRGSRSHTPNDPE
ncbi:Os11g0480000 [Oryza sativa Japonica Group]|uniref:Os11g0480000 protein n=2 Tax=Oryza sativa subsp. japonica TaxID=39947 RepID=Q0ISQ7_ORYSJ|nr:Os11g0480000 [Oryza sativa Japonica Group]BAT14030.1 Os11g0480000 [Oryza sativa Japonica Group]|eukprot:NP_001067895.1 Os11g0480000 [Oryza sativa Japonica Group]